jgi:putative ABC transport system permease protein
MLKNFFTIGIRNIRKQSFSSLLNILGLGMGLALVIFIALYLYDQHRYDRWYSDYERIYRLEFGDWGITGPVFKRIAEEASAGIEEVLRVNNNQLYNTPVRKGDETVRIRHLIAADPAVFDFFDLTILHGDTENPLGDMGSIVLTRSEAIRLFGKENPIGEVLRPQDSYNLVVTAVIDDIQHFHVKVDALVSFMLFGKFYGAGYFESGGNWNHLTYLKLHPEADVEQVRDQVQEKTHQFISESSGIQFDKPVFLRPVKDIYYTNEVSFESPVLHGNKTLSLAFMIIAGFVLFIAVVNFINLSTAHSASRAREMGIRKLLGGTRGSLMVQFLLESIIITAMGMLLALVLVEIFLPRFNVLAEIDISLREWSWVLIILAFLTITLVVGLVNGLYPAFYLSGFQPAVVLKGNTTKGKGAALFRKSLMVFQFATGIGLIAGTLIVYQQTNYMKNKEMNFNKENIVYFRGSEPVLQRWDEFRNSLTSSPDIREVALTNAVPGNVGWQESAIVDGETRQFYFWPATPEFFEMLEVNLLAGRWPDRNLTTDQQENVVVNEQWLYHMGFAPPWEDVIGENVRYGFGEMTIIGVVEDFHFNSLHQAIGPMAFVWWESRCKMVSIKIQEQNKAEALAHIEETWSYFYPQEPVAYTFLDDALKAYYDKEERTGMILSFFALFAIFIACLGLFGLSSFLMEKRSKEIALRKVLGAPMIRLHILLQREFVLLICFASIIAIPAGYYFMQSWVRGFPYQIAISPAPFVIAVGLTLLIALLTISWHANRVSSKNPSDFFRAE